MVDREKFEVSFKTINGKKVPIVKVRVEEKINPDGTKDVVIHAPSLDLLNKMEAI